MCQIKVNPVTDAVERARLERELLEYCELETPGMVELVKFLSRSAQYDPLIHKIVGDKKRHQVINRRHRYPSIQ